MSAAVALRSDPRPLRLPRVVRWAVPFACLVTVVARIPLVGRPLGPDEAGFLVVGQQWHAGGSSLYGNYWVDRPPGLVTIFGLAARLGGAVPLRLIGILAAVLVVVLAADLARRLAGRRAGAVAAVFAAALLANPRLGGASVNGELLAAPFVLGGLVTVVAALRATDVRSAAVRAIGAGILAVAALTIKQNMADVAVFAMAAGVLTWWRGDITIRRLGVLAAAGFGGAAVAITVAGGWTLAHGTSPGGVYEAMYPFRFHAAQVLEAYGSAGHAMARSHSLLRAAWTSGLLVVVAACCWGVLTRRMGGSVVWALFLLGAFDTWSILMGGNFWSHYLVQPLGVVAVLAGVLASHWRPYGGAMAAAVGALAAVPWVVFVASPSIDPGATIGSAIRTVAGPSDSIVTTWGNAEIVQASGLASPYPYLWSLPVKTLDPKLAVLDQLLDGPAAPTWIVAVHHVRSWGLDTDRTRQLIQFRYHRVATACGRTIYLRNGVDRRAPAAASCTVLASSGGAV